MKLRIVKKGNRYRVQKSTEKRKFKEPDGFEIKYKFFIFPRIREKEVLKEYDLWFGVDIIGQRYEPNSFARAMLIAHGAKYYEMQGEFKSKKKAKVWIKEVFGENGIQSLVKKEQHWEPI